MNTQIVTGSIADLAQKNHQSLAESFISCDVIVLVDVSGSMGRVDPGKVKTRYERACAALANLQASNPGKVAIISFESSPLFCPAGVPPAPGGTTDLGRALLFTQVADAVPGMRFVVISDGEPDNANEALNIARRYQNRIDVIFVGDETDRDAIQFMNQLATASGGKQITADSAQIAETVQFLLSSAT